MATYVSLIQFTDQGIRVFRFPTDRFEIMSAVTK